MKIADLFPALVVTLGLAWPGSASSATITSISGSWTASDPVVSGIGTEQINWGTPVYTDQSGYLFDSADVPIEVQGGETFYLGTFTHQNKTIRGTLLESAQLTVTVMFADMLEAITSVFRFSHLETMNEASSCPNGEQNGTGLNVNGCADRVTATLNEDRSDIFEIGGVSYYIDLSGFLYQGDLLDSFWTQERKDNEAILVGVLRQVETPPEVPLPAPGLLLLGAIGGLAVARSRRRGKARD